MGEYEYKRSFNLLPSYVSGDMQQIAENFQVIPVHREILKTTVITLDLYIQCILSREAETYDL